MEDPVVREFEFENRFWLQTLGDHARFIVKALSVFEKKEIDSGLGLIQQLDQLLNIARNNQTQEQLGGFSQKAYLSANNLKNLKLDLLRRKIDEDIDLNLSTTFLNQMISECEEYEEFLKAFLIGKELKKGDSLHHHLLWLPAMANHAEIIKASLDSLERKLQQKSEEFAVEFNHTYLKAIQFAGFKRSKPKNFSALNRFDLGVGNQVNTFLAFQKELQPMLMSGVLLGSITVLLLDHMVREGSYYLYKLSQISEVRPPTINPVQERVGKVYPAKMPNPEL